MVSFNSSSLCTIFIVHRDEEFFFCKFLQRLLKQLFYKGERHMKEIKHLHTHHATQDIPINFEEAYVLGQYTLEGCPLSDELTIGQCKALLRSTATLTALHHRALYLRHTNGVEQKCHQQRFGHRLPENAAEQIAGICAAVFDEDIAKSEFGFLEPKVPYAMDNCGMGGDLILTANVSTIAGLIAAAAGIPMCKHGSPGNATPCGSSDFVSLLGINTCANENEVERCVEQECFGYTEALDVRYKRIHTQTHKFANLPHMNDIIGPITNPLSPRVLTRRVVGINHVIPPRIVAEAYQILNERAVTHLERGMFIRGFVSSDHYDHYEGMDEVSICEGGTQIAELRNGELREYKLHASDFGLTAVSAEAISPPSGMSKGEFSLGILKGEISGPPLQMVLANAAILFYLADRSQDLKECYKMAEAVHRKGAAYEKALAIRKRLPK